MTTLLLLFLACGDKDPAADSGFDSGFIFDSGESTVPGDSEVPADDSATTCDLDGDGWCEEEGDCDENDPGVHPEAFDACDAVDNDCDNEIDEDGGGVYYLDEDGDGFGSATNTVTACDPPENAADNGADCDDEDADVHPGVDDPGDDSADGIDDDCDGETDEDPGEVAADFSATVTWDADGVDIALAGDATGWTVGMAETGVGDLGWYGESCIPGAEPRGYDDRGYDICQTFGPDGGYLPSVYPDFFSIGTGVTLFNEDIGNRGDITYIVFDSGSGACWVFGNDITYYDDFACEAY